MTKHLCFELGHSPVAPQRSEGGCFVISLVPFVFRSARSSQKSDAIPSLPSTAFALPVLVLDCADCHAQKILRFTRLLLAVPIHLRNSFFETESSASISFAPTLVPAPTN